MSRKNTYQSLSNSPKQVQSSVLELRLEDLSILTTEIINTITGLILVLVLIIINAALTA